MEPNKQYSKLAGDESIQKAIAALKANGIDAAVAATGEEARKKVFTLIPKGAEIMTMTSQTLEALGIAKELTESGNYNPVRKKFAELDKTKDGSQIQKLGAGPDYAIGSVHAVTEDGKLLIASATGSQLPAYAYGAQHVIWVVGAQKIVPDMNEAWKRLEEYTFPLENERSKKAYGQGSGINKVLIVNKEVNPNRLHLILVKENVGF